MTIWRMSCLAASAAVRQHVKVAFPEAEVARRYERLYARGFDLCLEPTVMALQPKVEIKNLELCNMLKASQRGLLGLKSSEDQATDSQLGAAQSFHHTLHYEARS